MKDHFRCPSLDAREKRTAVTRPGLNASEKRTAVTWIGGGGPPSVR